MSLFSPAATGTMAAGDVLNTIGETLDKVRAAARFSSTSSLTEITSIGRVEPIAMIDTDSMNSDMIGDALQCAHNISVAQYIQVISMMGNVGSINVMKTLDRLNPNRKPDVSGFLTTMINEVANESYVHLTSGSYNHFNLGAESFKLPNYALEADKAKTKEPEVDDDGNPIVERPKGSVREISSVNELTNLSTGKLINVTITDQGNSLTIPIAFRVLANEIAQSTIMRILTLQGLERSWTARYWKWRSGRIGFIKDLMLQRDLVRADKKAMMEDETGILSEIMRRAKNNKLAGFFSKNPSLNEAANILVFSEETAKRLKLDHNIDVDNFRQRQTVFDGSYAMIMVKIDREWERVTIYLSGEPLGSSLGKKELKGKAGKGSSDDMVELFRAMNKSSTPASLF